MEELGKPRIIRAGNLALNLDQQVLRIGGAEVVCLPTDFKLLQLLVENKRSIVSVDMISRHLYPDMDPAKMNTIRKHVSRLRELLMNNRVGNVIETIRGGGYRLNL